MVLQIPGVKGPNVSFATQTKIGAAQIKFRKPCSTLRGWLKGSAAFAAAGVAILLLFGSGCGGGSSSSSSITLSGTVYQGAVSAATVIAFAVNTRTGLNGAPLGAATTAGDGSFVLILRPAYPAPIRLTASGGSFLSEMNGATIGTPGSISALIASPATSFSGISINPLSEFVSSLTIGNLTVPGTTFGAAQSSAISKIELLYGLAADPATILPDYIASGVGTSAGNMGLALGALINEDQYLCPAAPGALVTALSADIEDGVFDGARFGTAIPYCGGALSAIAGTAQFEDALSGLPQLSLIPTAFAFGGTGNILTANGVANVALDGTMVYPLTPLATINSGLSFAAPPTVNQFANPQSALMNSARQNAAAVRLESGEVLIAGGLEGMTETLATSELYLPTGNLFANPQSATMKAARSFATGTLLPNGNVLIAGGTTTLPHALSTSELYIAADNCFAGQAATPCASIPAPPLMNQARQLATANRLPNGKILIAGGNDGSGNLRTCELYDPANNCFAGNAEPQCALARPLMNSPRDAAASVLLPNGKVLIAGGLRTSDAVASTELYNPALNCFAGVAGTPCEAETSPAMNVARLLASAVLLPNNQVLIAGGFNVTDGILSSTELYDPMNNCFAGNAGTPCAGLTRPTMQTARESATITLLPNGNVLIAGGIGNGGGSLASTELYDTQNNCFAGNPGTPCSGELAPAMTAARANASAALLTNGKVLIAGGSQETNTLSSTDLYTP
jgi:hypothetical protein